MNKKELPLISVVVPVYNVREYVEKCLVSIAGQSYKNIEVLVVDDGSTDGSGGICDEFARRDARFKVIHQKNGGLSRARNVGIKEAGGEFLCFVDSDDFVKKDFVRKLYEVAFREGADVAVCGYEERSREAVEDVLPEAKILSGEEATIRLLIQQENIDVIAWNKLYRRELFVKNNVRFPEGMKYEDNLTTYKLLSLAEKVVYISDALYVYLRRENSITGSDKKEERLRARELAARSAMDFFKKNGELSSAAKVSLLLAKYAFLDAAISGKVDAECGENALKWIRSNAFLYMNNPFMTKKLELYNRLNMKLDGKLYRVFRKIRHE